MRIRHKSGPIWLVCQAEGEGATGGDGGGGGGGAAVAPAPSGGDSGASPGTSGPSNPAEPAQMSYARHSSERDPTEGEVREVSRILEKGKDPSHTLSMEEIQSLLGMPMKFKPNAEVQAATTEVVDPAAAATVDPAAAAAAAAAAQTPPALSPDMKALVDALREVIPAKGDQTTPAAAADQKPKKFYGDINPPLEINPQLADAIFNAETPEQGRAALNFMVSGIMNKIADDMNGQILKAAKLMMAQIPQVAKAQIETRDFSKSFYGKFAELDKEAIRPIVGQLASAMGREYQKVGRPIGDEAFNAALAEATHKFLEMQLGTSLRPNKTIAQAPVTKATPAPQKKTPWIAPGGSRPAGGAAPNGKADDWTSLVI